MTAAPALTIYKNDLASLIERYFCQYLLSQRNVSPQTISSYRDTLCLFLRFSHDRFKKQPSSLTLADLDAPQVLAFLDFLEKVRNNSVRSRNQRLTAIRSFLRYAALHDPAALPSINRTLAIPVKRFDKPSVAYLLREEIKALLEAPDRATWSGYRDRVMFATMYNTGARVSEIIALSVGDLRLGSTTTLRIMGKGRKQRVVPLWNSTKHELKDWLRRIDGSADRPLFPSSRGERLTRAGVCSRLVAAAATAAGKCPTLRGRHLSPHVLRHTTAMHLLQSGVDITVIALWLGHESTTTTHRYVEADLTMKKRALDRIALPLHKRGPYQPNDRLLAFLESL